MYSIFVILFILSIIALLGHFGLPEGRLPDYPDPAPSKIIKGAEPFEFQGHGEGAKVGILLIHGFEGSPFTFRELGRFLNNKGYHVIAPLLPGHGTSEEDFVKTRFSHWYSKVEDTYLRHRTRFQYFFVMGLSMGGSLTLRLTEKFQNIHKPSGIVILSAPVFFNGFFNGKILIKDWRLMLSGILKIFITFLKKKPDDVNLDALAPWRGYNQFYTLPCVHSLKLSLNRIRSLLWKINIPLLLIHARNDRTVNIENQVYIYNHVRSREKLAYSFTLDDNVSTRHILTTHLQSQGRAFYYINKFIEDAMVDFEKPLPREVMRIRDKIKKLFKIT
jgi:carboxylesterase